MHNNRLNTNRFHLHRRAISMIDLDLELFRSLKIPHLVQADYLTVQSRYNVG